MKNIIKEFFYGNIREYYKELKCKNLLIKETDIYNKLINTLSLEQKHLFDEYIKIQDIFTTKYTEEKYSNGFKIGLLIGIETNKE